MTMSFHARPTIFPGRARGPMLTSFAASLRDAATDYERSIEE
jgi:hypothetical protein